METDVKIISIMQAGNDLTKILGLSTHPVGVRFIKANADYPEGAEVLKQHRYCQALMKARYGENVILDAEGIACPAAAAALGF